MLLLGNGGAERPRNPGKINRWCSSGSRTRRDSDSLVGGGFLSTQRGAIRCAGGAPAVAPVAHVVNPSIARSASGGRQYLFKIATPMVPIQRKPWRSCKNTLAPVRNQSVGHGEGLEPGRAGKRAAGLLGRTRRGGALRLLLGRRLISLRLCERAGAQCRQQGHRYD